MGNINRNFKIEDRNLKRDNLYFMNPISKKKSGLGRIKL
jgi:hypothetical protein